MAIPDANEWLGYLCEVAMKPTIAILTVLLIATSGSTAMGQDEHKIVQPQEIKWGPAPAVLPPGAQTAVPSRYSTKPGCCRTSSE
jgi:hypothetical protein